MSMYNQVNYLFEYLFNGLINKYDEKPISVLFNNYAYALHFWCYTNDYEISDDLKEKLGDFVAQKKLSKDFRTHDWSRLPQLLALDYVLNQNNDSLKILLTNISCHQSSERLHHILSASWICQGIDFSNQILKQSFQENVTSRHGYGKENLLLLLNCRDLLNQRQAWFSNNVEYLKSMSNDSTVETFSKGGLVLCETFIRNFQDTTLFTAGEFATQLGNFAEASEFDAYIILLKSHPLNRIQFGLPLV